MNLWVTRLSINITWITGYSEIEIEQTKIQGKTWPAFAHDISHTLISDNLSNWISTFLCKASCESYRS